MDFKELINEPALDDLQEIVDNIAEDDPAASERIGESLIEEALSLGNFLERCGFHDATRGIRKMLARPYLIYFNVDRSSKVVNVMHFWHGARQPPPFS